MRGSLLRLVLVPTYYYTQLHLHAYIHLARSSPPPARSPPSPPAPRMDAEKSTTNSAILLWRGKLARKRQEQHAEKEHKTRKTQEKEREEEKAQEKWERWQMSYNDIEF